MPTSPEWDILLEPFASCFTRPGYRYFCAFVLVFAHLDHRLWVTQVVLSGLVDRHFTSFYRFLREGAWKTEEVAERLWQQCRSVCAGAGHRVFIAVDDTVCKKTGERFFGLGTHHDPMNTDHDKRLSQGHCFVCLAVLGFVGPQGSHAVALFVSCALYLQKSACTKGTEAQPFRTKLQLAADRLLALSVPAGQVVCAVADGAYAKRAFVKTVVDQGRQVISRLRSDAVFYDLPPVRKKGRKGAPRKYGNKWKGREWASQAAGWREVRLCLYGQTTCLSVKTRVVLLRSLGVKARLVAVKWNRDGKGKIVFLFSTDTAMTPEEVVSAYCARFAIETGFRDSKQLFALSTYQVRSQTSILRIVHLCLWAQSLLRLRFWDQTGQTPTEETAAGFGGWRKPLSYLTLGQQKRLSQRSFSLGSGLDTLNPINPSEANLAA